MGSSTSSGRNKSARENKTARIPITEQAKSAGVSVGKFLSDKIPKHGDGYLDISQPIYDMNGRMTRVEIGIIQNESGVYEVSQSWMEGEVRRRDKRLMTKSEVNKLIASTVDDSAFIEINNRGKLTQL